VAASPWFQNPGTRAEGFLPFDPSDTRRSGAGSALPTRFRHGHTPTWGNARFNPKLTSRKVGRPDQSRPAWPVTVGCARVSTYDQTVPLQQDAIEQVGCKETFTETISGAKGDRPGLDEALRFLREGDTLVVWRLDRLGRSLKYLIEVMTTLNERRIGFRTLTERMDTTTSRGKLIFDMFGALANFERDLIRGRTEAGLAADRARGRLGGRRKALDTSTKVAMAQALYADKSNPTADICRIPGASRASRYRCARPGTRIAHKEEARMARVPVVFPPHSRKLRSYPRAELQFPYLLRS